MSTNLSKQKRDALVAKIKVIHKYIATSPQDENTSVLLGYIAELEKEVKTKKYGLVFEEHREAIDEILETHVPVLNEQKDLFIDNGGQMNFLIEGDNLAALQLLQKTHKGKIDLIYIDPPYNTGNKDFIYDDNYIGKDDAFRHSKWINFITKRLKLAKPLLKPTASLFISIDDNEVSAMRLICDSILGGQNFVACLPTIMNLKGNQDQFGFAGTHEYTLVYCVNPDKAIFNQFELEDEDLDDWQEDIIGHYKKGANLKSTGVNAPRTKRPFLYFPILINKTSNELAFITTKEYENIYNAKEKSFNDDFVDKLREKYQRENAFLLPITNNEKCLGDGALKN